jgi:hypothetical protein
MGNMGPGPKDTLLPRTQGHPVRVAAGHASAPGLHSLTPELPGSAPYLCGLGPSLHLLLNAQASFKASWG